MISCFLPAEPRQTKKSAAQQNIRARLRRAAARRRVIQFHIARAWARAGAVIYEVPSRSGARRSSGAGQCAIHNVTVELPVRVIAAPPPPEMVARSKFCPLSMPPPAPVMAPSAVPAPEMLAPLLSVIVPPAVFWMTPLLITLPLKEIDPLEPTPIVAEFASDEPEFKTRAPRTVRPVP
jgi:hypothetical protein